MNLQEMSQAAIRDLGIIIAAVPVSFICALLWLMQNKGKLRTSAKDDAAVGTSGLYRRDKHNGSKFVSGVSMEVPFVISGAAAAWKLLQRYAIIGVIYVAVMIVLYVLLRFRKR